MRKHGHIPMTRELLESQLGLKEGVHLVGFVKDEMRDCYCVVLTSESFNEVAEGACAPQLNESTVFKLMNEE